jgi:TRAP-type C4-dicarboxylate transport system permease small subunit
MEQDIRYIQSFSRFIQIASSWLERIGAIAIFGIVLIPCLDVLGSKLLQLPVPGSYEIVVCCQLVGISFAVSGSLLKGRHVAVEILDTILPKRLKGVIDIFVSLLGLSLFSILCWQSIDYGHSLKAAGEVSGTIGIPFYPFAYGLAFSCVPVCLLFIVYCINSLQVIFGK